MSSVAQSRASGRRREHRHGGKSLLAPTLGVHNSEVGEGRLNLKQVYALESMYCSHPAVQAARTVLHSQLLAGGLQLVRNGEPLKVVKFGERGDNGTAKTGVTESFNAHLDEHWLPFARDVVDCFLKWGMCVVILEVQEPDPSIDAIARLKREVGITDGGKKRKASVPPVLIPHVPGLGTYEVAWSPRGKYGYTRQYVVYTNAPGRATRIDDEAVVHVRQHPDNSGNVNSPLATVYEQGSFTSALIELAFTAEISRSQPAIVTQLRKPEKGNQLDPGSLFFDAESRNVATEQEGEESTSAARALQTQAAMCELINKLQTRGADGGSTSTNPTGRPSFVPPEVPPKLFVLPKDHELAPHVQMPQPRGDLESMIRLGIDQFCSALGVPSALLFEARFSNNSTTQLQLLNSTVAQLAKAVNEVLTKTYNALYAADDGGDEEPAQLRLLTSPLNSSEEVEKLFTSQIIDIETALPAAMHALGATADEVEAAVERSTTKASEQKKLDDEERAFAKQDRDLNLKERTVGLESTKAAIEKTKKEAAGMVKPSAGGGGASSSSSEK